MGLTDLFVAGLGVLAGFLNTVSGGGSAVTLPALAAAGIAPHLANGANHVALLASALTRIGVFGSSGVIDWRRVRPLAVAVGAGAAAGVVAESRIPEPILGAAALPASVLALLLILGGMRHFRDRGRQPRRAAGGAHHVVFFVLGFWGGLAAIGIGAFLLWALVLLIGFDLRLAVAQKSALMLAIAAIALIGFSAAEEIAWPLALPLSAGNIVGSAIAARFVLWRQSGRWIYMLVAITASLELAWLLLSRY